MEVDFSDITLAANATGVVVALLALGLIKLSAGFTMNMIDKVAGFFGYDPFDRNNH